MEIGELYQFVLLLVLVGMVLGIGILVLDKFSASSGVTAAAQDAINDTRDSLGTVASTWLPLIVTVAILAIVLTLVIRSFVAYRR